MRSTRFERTSRLDGHGDIVGLAYLPRDREDGVAELDFKKTVADIDAERMKLESDQAFLRSEMASMGLILGEEIDGTWSEFLLPCKALQDEYELLQRRLDQLPRERVQAQLRERERE